MVHARIASPASWQDIVMLSDGQFRSCYSVLRQSRMKIVRQWSSTCSTLTLHVHELWLTPSLKQSHYKLDMTSVTPAIITGQDSWPLPVMAHVVIRSNTTHWFSAEPHERKLFHNAVYCIRRWGVFFFFSWSSCRKLAAVCFSSRRNHKSDSEFFFFLEHLSINPFF